MNSMLQSSLQGLDFVNYRKNKNINDRKRFSDTVKEESIAVVIDSVDITLSQALAGPGAKRYNQNGKEYLFHKDLTIEDILLEVTCNLNKASSPPIYQVSQFKLGLENGKVLTNNDVLSDLYKKYKHQKDNILYLLLTKETTMYSYIISLLRYIFGENFMK